MLPIIHTLGDRMVTQCLERAQRRATRLRQEDAAMRLDILEDDWKHVAWRYIGERYPDREQVSLADLRDALRRRISRTMNPLKRIADTICVAYSSEPERTLHEAAPQQVEAWNAILQESRVATKAKKWERYAWALNVIIVVPVVRPGAGGKRLDLDVIYPHHAEVQHDAGDPMGEPSAMAYRSKIATDYNSGQSTEEWVVVDREAFRYHDLNGKHLRTIPHNAGVFPGVDFRLCEPTDDWWCSSRGDGVVDATLNCMHLGARMEFIRDQQDRFREILFSNKQLPTAVWAALLQIPDEPSETAYQNFNAVLDPEYHLKQIRWHYHTAAESMGVPSILVDFEPGNAANSSPLAAAQVHEALAAVRNEHIAWLTDAEERLWYRAGLVMQGMGHPLARVLTPDLIHDRFRLTFGPLAFAEHPKAKLEIAEKEIELGLLSTARAYMRLNPQCKTIDEAMAAVIAVAEEEAKLNDLYVSRNLSRDTKQRRLNLAQIQGAMGGRPPQNEDNDDGQ